MASTPKLVYFDLRGRGELIRYVFTVAGVEFDEERIDFGEWTKLKDSTPSPNKKLPYMEIEGKLFAESSALARYWAKKYDLTGKNDLEALAVDMYYGQAEDVRGLIYLFMLNPIFTEEQKKSLQDSFANEKCAAAYDMFEKALSESSSGFLVGESLTLADLALADVNDQVERVAPGVHDKFPQVKKHWDMVKAIPKMADYLAKRKDIFI